MFTNDAVRIYRAQNSNKFDKSVTYITAFKIGKINSMNFAMTHMVARFYHSALYSKFVTKLKISSKTMVEARVASDQIILQLLVLGEDRDKIEAEMERFLTEMRNLLNFMSEGSSKSMQHLAHLQIEKEYDSVEVYGNENSESLYLSSGVVYDLKKQTVDLLRGMSISLESFKGFLKMSFDGAERVAFEYSNHVDEGCMLYQKDTYLNKPVEVRRHLF